MNIYSKPGTKVVYEGIHGYDIERQAASKLFEVGQVLTVDYVDVGGCSSQVFFRELPNRGFNTVLFEDTSETLVLESTLVDFSGAILGKYYYTPGMNIKIDPNQKLSPGSVVNLPHDQTMNVVNSGPIWEGIL